jgi:hypothetical protein
MATKKQTALYLRSNEQAVDVFYEIWDRKTIADYESIYVIFIDKSSRKILGHGLHSTGDSNSCLMYCEKILKEAIVLGADGIIVAHNHPSGSVTPSDIDIKSTQLLYLKAKVLNIELLDHIIIGNNQNRHMSLLKPANNPCTLLNKRFDGIFDERSCDSLVLSIADKFFKNPIYDIEKNSYQAKELVTNLIKVYTKFFDPIIN